jgi:uncharacterized GH25 family protein
MVLAILMCVLVSALLSAHEFFVKPAVNRVYRSGDTVNLELYSTHYFFVGEELEEPPSINEVYVLQSGKWTPVPLRANQSKIIYEGSYRLVDNTPAVVVANRKRIFYSTTTKGGQEGSKSEVTAKGFTVTATSWNEKWSKTYINPDPSDQTYQIPIGHNLEIVPITNPANIRRGQAASFKILYKGQPLPNTAVSASYDTFNPKEENAYALNTTTDRSGQFSITPTANGVWFVRVNVTQNVAGSTEYTSESLSAIVVFTVK